MQSSVAAAQFYSLACNANVAIRWWTKQSVPSNFTLTHSWRLYITLQQLCMRWASKKPTVLSRSCLRPQHSMNLGLSASLIYHISISWWSVFTAAQWLRLWGHSKSSVGFLWGIYMFTMCLCGFSPGDSFFPQSWDVHVMLHSNSKLALGVNMTTNDCTSLCASP